MRLIVGLSLIGYVLSVSHPDYSPLDVTTLSKTAFFEPFDYDDLSSSNWIPSTSKRDNSLSYKGKWEIDTPDSYPGFINDKGLVMKTPAAHYAISYKFDEPFDNTDKDLVLQYEIKPQNGVTCAGTYIKLLSEDFSSQGSFNSNTPYQLMFGPDKCGSSDKVHLILNKLNPISQTYEEKHLTSCPLSKSLPLSTLYTLILKTNGDFEIRLNGDIAKAGNFITKPHLVKPEMTPPKEIIDENDTKPEDWDDREFIPDLSQTKPDDYDEKYLAASVPDPSMVKPQGWLDDEPELIVDTNAVIPELWDEEEDGKWEPPSIPNPKCTSGCGEWNPPMVPNKEYKGPWIQPVIENPNYQGEWLPRVIDNPYYYEEKHPCNLQPIGGIGFELWAIESNILFDNIYLGNSIEEAESIGNKTWLPKYQLEGEDYDINKPKPLKGSSEPPPSFDELMATEDSVSLSQILTFFKLLFYREYLNILDFWIEFNKDPANTIMNDPLKAVVYSGIFVLAFTIGFGLMNVFAFIVSSWARAIKQAASEGANKVNESPDSNENVPKIVEILDEEEDNDTNKDVKIPNTSGSEARTTSLSHRETRSSKRKS